MYIKIILFFLIVAFLPLMVASFFSYLQVRENSLNIIKQGTSNLIDEIKVVLDKEISAATKHIRLLAESELIISDKVPLEIKTQEMRRMYELFRVFDDVTLISRNGVIVTSLKYDFRGDWRYKAWFHEALVGKVGVSPVHVITNPIRFVIIVTAPVFGSGRKVSAVLAGRVGLERIWEISDKIKVGKTGSVFIADANGKIISFADKQRILSKITPENLKTRLVAHESGVVEFVDEDNVTKFCFYSTLKGVDEYAALQWRVGVIQSKSEVYAVIDRMIKQLGLIVFLCVLVIGILAFMLSNNIVGPIKSLVRASERVSQGNFEEGVDIKSDDEIGELGKAFNKMISGLKDSTVSIKVLEKEQKRFQDVAERAGGWVWEVDMLGQYTYSSSIVERILGYRPEELIKKKYFYDFFLPAEREKLKKETLEAFSAQLVFNNFINLNIRKDGSMVVLETSALPIFDANGKLIGYRGVDHDVTERNKMAEEAKKHLHELEVFYKVSNGREERIIELKKEVDTLKKELGK